MVDFWSLPNVERRARIDALMKDGLSDIDRWRDPLHADGALDHSRSIDTASFIEPGSNVLDLGCGAMVLKKYLPQGCTYIPCDIHDRGGGCLVADLNKREFPPGMYRYIAMLGVLEYAYDPDFVLERASQQGSILLLDYHSAWTDTIPARRNCGWVNDLRPGDIVEALIRTNWRHIALRKLAADRYLYICESRINGSNLDWGRFHKKREEP